MKRYLTALAVIAMSLAAFGANAATINGVVRSVDPKHDAITLQDGSVFALAEGSEAENFKPGTKVTITYAKQGGKTSPRPSISRNSHYRFPRA